MTTHEIPHRLALKTFPHPSGILKQGHHDVAMNSETRPGGFPGGTNDKEPACQCRRLKRLELDAWVRKILWRRAWQLTPVFLPEESPLTEEPGGATVHMVTKSWTSLKQLSQHAHSSKKELFKINYLSLHVTNIEKE